MDIITKDRTTCSYNKSMTNNQYTIPKSMVNRYGIARTIYDVNIEDIDKFNGANGVYILRYSNDHVYVGAAVDLRHRLYTHLKNPKCRADLICTVYITKTRFDAYRLERHLIFKIRPDLNTRYPKIKYSGETADFGRFKNKENYQKYQTEYMMYKNRLKNR